MTSMDVHLLRPELKPILLSEHAAERREQRKITMGELKTAIRYGVKEYADNNRWRYTWNGVVVITDLTSSTILTSWTLPGFGVDLPKVNITPKMKMQHLIAMRRLKDTSTWTSHTVAVVDTSGSMRKTDADEALSRSELVWLTLAVQLVASNLKSGERSDTDVLSVVGMQIGGKVMIQKQPYDWLLYNQLVDMLRSHSPEGPGEYFPALRKAQALLMENQYGGCALSLLFLSDGRPSDHSTSKGPKLPHETRIKLEISDIASQIGSRLSIMAIPLGSGTGDSDFGTLKALIQGAEVYGCRGLLQRPSLSAQVLQTSMKKLTSATTATMLNLGKRVCRKFRKEPLSNVGGRFLTDEFDFVRQESFVPEGDEHHRVYWRILKTSWASGEGWTPSPRHMLFHSEAAVGLAIKKTWFGEGAERLVKELREVDGSGSFVGPVLVAKDTKYIHVDDGQDKVGVEKDFHRVFIKSQKKAQKYAEYFNEALQNHPAIDPEICPRIEFLDCAVYMIEPTNGKRQGYLVERMLDLNRFKYQKWNDNRGSVSPCDDMVEPILERCEDESTDSPYYKRNDNRGSVAPCEALLEPIREECDDESTDSSYCNSRDLGNQNGESLCEQDTDFNLHDIPQAFSCFSYWFSERRFLICDLQGVFNTDIFPYVFELTDPVIHHRQSTNVKRVYGRSDNGLDGIHKFLLSHQCSPVCRMVRARAFVGLNDIRKSHCSK